MGIYLNPGNDAFQESIQSEIYVDKTELIRYTNRVLGTEQKYICVSRPRRFGKTMAAEMLAAYYSRGCRSKELFSELKIGSEPSFEKYLNQYHVLFWNIQNFLSRVDKTEEVLFYLQERVLEELQMVYEDIVEKKETSLITALEKIYDTTKQGFIFIIDEWDCIFREQKSAISLQIKYLDFLRDLLKDQSYVKLAYITGILPIKKYGTHSALNMFDEYSMIRPQVLAEYVGFTEDEVRRLCDRYDMDFKEAKRWYDGYQFRKISHIYSPKSVVDAMRNQEFDNYWTQTETYEALKIYIDMNFYGLKDAIITMLGGGRCAIDAGTFQNDMTTLESRDDVLTLLIHLGYLAYDAGNQEVFIPNEEIQAEFARTVKRGEWTEIIRALTASDQLLEATLHGEEERVAAGIDAVHAETTSILNYNNENALSCVISLAYYSARRYYTLIRELPTGKGFADMVFLPLRRYSDKKALLIELKWNLSAEGAIAQIKKKQYIAALNDYQGEILLVGINYEKESKQHTCKIEEMLF